MPSGHVPDASPAEDDTLGVDTSTQSYDLAVKSIIGHRCWESLCLKLGTVLLVGLSCLCSDIGQPLDLFMVFPDGSDGKESACNAGGLGLIPGSGRSPGEENGNPLQYSCLENPMDREAWRATVHGIAKSWDMTE